GGRGTDPSGAGQRAVWTLGGLHAGRGVAWAGAASGLGGVALPVAQGPLHADGVRADPPGGRGLARRAARPSGGGPGLPLAPVPVDAAPGALGLDGAAARDPRRHCGRPGPTGADPAGRRLTGLLDGAARPLWPRPARAARHAGHRPRAGRAALASTWASQRAPALGPVRTPPGAPGPQASAPTPGWRTPDRSLGGALYQPSDLVGGRAQL